MPNQSLDIVFAALADPTRRGIVERLVTRPATVSELAAPLAMSLPAVMQHLRALENASLIHSRKAGRVRTCQLDPDALRMVERWVTAQRTTWEHRLDRLSDALTEEDTR